MNLLVSTISITALIFVSIINGDVCTEKQCACSESLINVNCDTKGWVDLSNRDFPSNVVTLSLVNNKLKFDTSDDLSKIENLNSLKDLSLNQNPLGAIPSFKESKIRSLSLQDTSLISAEFPSSYFSSFLQTISLSNNKIRTIKEKDFIALRNSKVNKLHIDSASLSTINQNAFTPLIQLQSLSLQNNQLKSCEYLSTLPLLSSIKLDGNQFTSLPQELSAPNKIQTFSFTFNSISIIDESSPLHTWFTTNKTNIKVYLANNSFDCCKSLWFIRFLNTASHFIGDATLLTCVTPSDLAGKKLIELNPDGICGNIVPNPPWWTIGRVLGVIGGGLTVITAVIIIAVVFARQERSRSGYTEIRGVDDPLPNAPPLSSSTSEFQFPAYGADDDTLSTYSTTIRNTNGSEAPTQSIVGEHI